jgi:hypothetical protein
MLPDFYFQPFSCFSKTQTTIKFKSNSTQKFLQSLQEKSETTQYRLPNRNIEESQNITLYPFSHSTEKQENPKKNPHSPIIRNSPRKFLSKTIIKIPSTHLIP